MSRSVSDRVRILTTPGANDADGSRPDLLDHVRNAFTAFQAFRAWRQQCHDRAGKIDGVGKVAVRRYRSERNASQTSGKSTRNKRKGDERCESTALVPLHNEAAPNGFGYHPAFACGLHHQLPIPRSSTPESIVAENPAPIVSGAISMSSACQTWQDLICLKVSGRLFGRDGATVPLRRDQARQISSASHRRMASTALPHERGHGMRKCGPVAHRFCGVASGIATTGGVFCFDPCFIVATGLAPACVRSSPQRRAEAGTGTPPKCPARSHGGDARTG
jgi:hypothetical protein